MSPVVACYPAIWGIAIDSNRRVTGRKAVRTSFIFRISGAPTARNIPAWAEGPGKGTQKKKGLKARNIRAKKPLNQAGLNRHRSLAPDLVPCLLRQNNVRHPALRGTGRWIQNSYPAFRTKAGFPELERNAQTWIVKKAHAEPWWLHAPARRDYRKSAREWSINSKRLHPSCRMSMSNRTMGSPRTFW